MIDHCEQSTMDSLLAKVRSIDPMSILEDDGSQNLEDLKLDSSEYQYHAEDLIRLLSVEKEINIVEALTAILLALRQDTVDDIQRLNLLLSSELHPILIPANGPPSRGAEALVSLKIILQMVKFHKVINPALLVPVIAYMDPCDDWNSHRLNALTLEILKSYVQNGGCIEEVMDLVLSQVIRPAISSIGLKQRTTSLATLQDHSTDRPWHNRGFFLRRMYEWILTTCSPEYAANHWSQLLPFVLNLLDDTDIPSRTSGLRYSIIVVNKLPHQIILINGIGQVIWDAVFPVISIMPGVYPEHEVIQVVELAYASLACIASKNDQQKKMALLDKMLREGVFTNYSHASQYSSMIELFLREMATITDAMGIHAVKHLKDIIPIVSMVMTDPFLPDASIKSVYEACIVLEKTLAACWVRIKSLYAGEVLNMICICWLNLKTAMSPARHLQSPEKGFLRRVEERLIKIAAMMKTLLDNQGDTEFSIRSLLQAQPFLQDLFKNLPSNGGMLLEE